MDDAMAVFLERNLLRHRVAALEDALKEILGHDPTLCGCARCVPELQKIARTALNHG